jgi:hypothetical protein
MRIFIPAAGGSGTPGGSNGQIQYNNSGAFGGIATTGSGSAVLANTPTLVTPALGAATATSVNGVTIPSATDTAALLGTAQTFTAVQTFTNNDIKLLGSSTGATTFTSANAGASNYTLTFPAITDTLVSLTASQTLTNKTLTSPTLTTPALGIATATSINKVALTAPATGSTLTIADGKTLTANNSLTLAGTDSTTMTFPATSDTLAGLAQANTFTAAQVVSGASFGLSGNISASGIYGTAGIRYKNTSATLNDTTSSGTIATAYTDVWGGNTYTATSATTITQQYGSYFKTATASTNVTFTNKSALGADSISIGGAAQSTYALAVTGTTALAGALLVSTGNISAAGGNISPGGGNLLIWSGHGSLSSPASAQVQVGQTNNAAPSSQLLSTEGARSGTDTDTGGGNLTIQSGQGTGAGAVSSIILKAPALGSTGTTGQTMTTALTILATGVVVASGKTFTLGNAATTGLTAGVLAASTNASIVITDSAGQAYRIPCII